LLRRENRHTARCNRPSMGAEGTHVLLFLCAAFSPPSLPLTAQNWSHFGPASRHFYTFVSPNRPNLSLHAPRPAPHFIS
jgi:hypothetical protein